MTAEKPESDDRVARANAMTPWWPAHPRVESCERYWIGGTADGAPCRCPQDDVVTTPGKSAAPDA